MICKKCGHDVDKYEVIMIINRDFYPFQKYDSHCPCGEKLT